MKMCEKKTHSVRWAPYLYTWFLVAVSLCGAVSGLPCLLLWHTGGAVYGTLRHGAVSAHTQWGFVRRTSALARLAWRCCGLPGFCPSGAFWFFCALLAGGALSHTTLALIRWLTQVFTWKFFAPHNSAALGGFCPSGHKFWLPLCSGLACNTAVLWDVYWLQFGAAWAPDLPLLTRFSAQPIAHQRGLVLLLHMSKLTCASARLTCEFGARSRHFCLPIKCPGCLPGWCGNRDMVLFLVESFGRRLGASPYTPYLETPLLLHYLQMTCGVSDRYNLLKTNLRYLRCECSNQ